MTHPILDDASFRMAIVDSNKAANMPFKRGLPAQHRAIAKINAVAEKHALTFDEAFDIAVEADLIEKAAS